MNELDDLFKQTAQTIFIYIALETETDPFEHTVSKTVFPPLPIKAIVNDLTSTQAKWKMTGIETNRAKEILIHKRDIGNLELSNKIEIDGIDFLGWRDNGQLQTRKEGDYYRCYVYTEK